MCRYAILLVIGCLIVTNGCLCKGICTKRENEVCCPTDVRKTHFWCFGEDAIIHGPCGPKEELYGYEPTSWREFPAVASACYGTGDGMSPVPIYEESLPSVAPANSPSLESPPAPLPSPPESQSPLPPNAAPPTTEPLPPTSPIGPNSQLESKRPTTQDAVDWGPEVPLPEANPSSTTPPLQPLHPQKVGTAPVDWRQELLLNSFSL